MRIFGMIVVFGKLCHLLLITICLIRLTFQPFWTCFKCNVLMLFDKFWSSAVDSGGDYPHLSPPMSFEITHVRIFHHSGKQTKKKKKTISVVVAGMSLQIRACNTAADPPRSARIIKD